MNLNKKIRKFTGDGIRGYNEAINELVDATNWLSGIRVINGKPITESDQGPVIDLSQVSSTQNQQPWAVDPDGNTAGWVKMTHIDLDGSVTGFTNALYKLWTWVGIPPSPPGIKSVPIPWMVDPSNVPANWVVCAQQTFWGTGSCPVIGGNFQQVHFTSNGPTGTNPLIYTGNVLSPPINPPTLPPAFYLVANPPPANSGLPNKPALVVSIQMLSTDTSPISANFTWTIVYDGTQVFNVSGSVTAQDFNHELQYCVLDPTDWLYDPGGLPGYSQGNKQWIWEYNGPISANTNPVITQTFSYTCSKPSWVNSWNTILLTK